MKNLTKTLLVCITMALALLAGCGESSNVGNEYIGKWVRVDSDKHTLEIEGNGGNFMVRKTEPDHFARIDSNDPTKTENIPATLKDGILQMPDGHFLALDKASGNLTNNLTNGKFEYKRGT